ncbi:MAG: NUDIX domain-containing protein [Alkalibacterium sp.]|uniref:NUDIX domain-containing protein n=1 Tax=Alkalibacterium gilvum TaxID=1130080 RepID=A0A1H6VGI1_9LACT|nr:MULTISPECIES: NUDIX domain-containing protein [Alkalibacterium]MDN6196093.1 NUDIX domain-containing protein [Atopostipes suicloacalis]MDN6294304.1 NUDIX domain-containing protein [Alkalibacterium sp.]MDN6295850.1 NUDIX domain-containing protein [Alkalibacterium sp.]SEJ03759.1 NUDIX domain-containing protein [Alkalibacterium gilvum]
MIKENHYVASTILVKDEDGRYVFLVKEEKEGYSFPASIVEPEKTGLACVIKRLKEIVNIEIENLELNELTNAIVADDRIPLFVFTYENETFESPKNLLKDDSDLSWVNSENIIYTLEDWKISGVPQFLFI